MRTRALHVPNGQKLSGHISAKLQFGSNGPNKRGGPALHIAAKINP
jgi:hypothetical protein